MFIIYSPIYSPHFVQLNYDKKQLTASMRRRRSHASLLPSESCHHYGDHYGDYYRDYYGDYYVHHCGEQSLVRSQLVSASEMQNKKEKHLTKHSNHIVH